MEESQCGSYPQKMINSVSNITDLSLCFRPVVRPLKDFYVTNRTRFLMKTTYYHPTSQDFDLVSLA